MKRDLMMAEYSSWQRIVRYWHEHSGDINADNALVAAIRLWGEDLARLRRSQSQEVWDRAENMAEDAVGQYCNEA